MDDRGARLRARRRPLAVRGLRLRPPGARLPPDRRALLPRHRAAQGEGRTGPRPARLGPRLGRLQRRPARLRQAHPPGPALLARRRGTPRRAPQPRRRPDQGLRSAGQGRRGSADRGIRALSRQPRRPQRRRHAAGDQRARGPGLRQGRGRERGALLVARAGAARPGGRRALLRAGDGARRRVRSLRRHAQPGLRGPGRGDKGDQQGRRRDREPGRHLSRQAGGHLLLLVLRRADRELGVRLLGGDAGSRTCGR